MTYKTLLLCVVVIVTGTVEVAGYYEPVATAPQAALAQVKKKTLLIRRQTSSYFYQPVTALVGRQAVTKYVMREAKQSATQEIPLNDVQAFNHKGKAIEKKALKDKLSKESPVLLVTNLKLVNPMFLRLLKKDTVILQLPADTTPAPSDAPPPAGTTPVPPSTQEVPTPRSTTSGY